MTTTKAVTITETERRRLTVEIDEDGGAAISETTKEGFRAPTVQVYVTKKELVKIAKHSAAFLPKEKP